TLALLRSHEPYVREFGSLLQCFRLVHLPSIVFFSQCFLDPRHLHSFPTRRSSDLVTIGGGSLIGPSARERGGNDGESQQRRHERSEEHTSELQSHLNLVCRLLLEKKKQE